MRGFCKKRYNKFFITQIDKFPFLPYNYCSLKTERQITLNYIKNCVLTSKDYIKTLFKWIAIALAVGILGGVVGSAFHICVDEVTHLRGHNGWMLFLLPLGGIVIAAMYRAFKSKGPIDTNLVIKSVRENDKIPLVMVPLIFISTVITHAFGGSAGREGAALQIGGGIGYNLGKLFKLNKTDLNIITMAGMSSVFAALFGTPVTAAVFSLEVVSVGAFNFMGILPCIIASITAFLVATFFGIPATKFGISFGTISADAYLKVLVLGILCAILSIVFCLAIKKTEHYMDTLIKNTFVRGFAGGVIIVGLTLLVGTTDYNGAGMEVITKAISGSARYWDFALKIIFTAITISAGFKGGEIVPTFFIGATFGCVVAPLIGLDPSIGAAIGLVALFCGMVNCPIASVFLGIELFGAEGILLYATACAVSYVMSGYTSLYKTQKIVYSKTNAEYVDMCTK